MAKNNAINNRLTDFTIDPGATGDSYVQFAINGTDEWRLGVDDDADDAYKLAQGSALGIHARGRRGADPCLKSLNLHCEH